MKLNPLRLSIWFCCLLGIPALVVSSYLMIEYYYLSHSRWYLFDLFIDFINIIGLFILLAVLLNNKTRLTILLLLHKIFIIAGLIGLSIMMILTIFQACLNYEIPNLLMKWFICFPIVHGYLTKEIYNQRIKETTSNGLKL
jgi:hypothetical protein